MMKEVWYADKICMKENNYSRQETAEKNSFNLEKNQPKKIQLN